MIKGNLYLPGRARVPIPKKSVEEGDKLGGKVMLSVDFKTGEIKWDKEMEDKMGFRVEVSKDDFLKAITNNKSQAGAIRELNIGSGTFYKYKKMWAKDIAEMENARETKFAEILDSVDEGKPMPAEPAKFTKVCEGVYIEPTHAPKTEPEEIHTPTPAEVEEFFEEVSEPVKESEGEVMSVLAAVDMLNDLREESATIETIWDVMRNMPFHPTIKTILKDSEIDINDMILDIQTKLSNIKVTI